MAERRALTETMEEYLQAIYYLGKDGRPVIAARLAEWLNVAPPTVTAMIDRLQRDGLLEKTDRREIRFTEAGRAEAHSIARRHYLAERLLTDLLGLSWSTAHAEADRWEHAISPATEARLLDVLGQPKFCPHGSPIPGTGGRTSPNSFPLTDAAPGERVIVSHIVESAEEDPELLAYLETNRIMPGRWLTIARLDRAARTLTVRGPAEPGPPMAGTLLGFDVARQIYVLAERHAAEAPPRVRPRLRRTDHLAAALRRVQLKRRH